MNTFLNFLTNYAAFVGFLIAWAAQLLVARSYKNITRAAKSQSAPKAGEDKSVSVIIPAHNQADALRRNLPSILEQDHNSFEVIVVNTSSTDDTEEMLNNMELRYPHLRHTFIPNSSRHISPKRMAVTIGFKSANYELTILTEPDCHPQSTQWLRTMTNAFTAGTQIVLGYTNYTPERTGIRSRLFFRLYHQIQYLTWATHHKAYRGSLTNLGYRKSYFMSHKGFAEDVNLICGAGELLVNRHSTSDNTAVVLQPEAKMLQDPVLSSKDWTEKNVRYMETRRHFIKTGAYRFIFNLKQWIPVVFFLFWLATLGMACINRQYHIVAGISTLIYLLTNIWQTIQFNSSCRTLEEKPYGINLSIYLITLPFRHVSSLMRYMQRSRRSFQRHAI